MAQTHGQTDPSVAVSGLVKIYGGRRVVDGLSWSAAAGAVTAVLGRNGAGKTTTLECCEGLRRADGGVVRVLGTDPVGAGPALRARVGVMLQDGGLPTGARAGQLLAHLAALHARPHDPATLLEFLGLSDQARTTVRRLSGGQRQRLALAAAVVGRPDVVFLDEPTAGLDPQARQTVWALIRRLRADGVAVVLSTHLLDEAERLADRLVIVDAGRIVADDTPAGLTATDAVQFDTPPGWAGGSAAAPTGLRLDEPTPGRLRARRADGRPVDPHDVATLTAWCATQGVLPEGLLVGRRPLEDVFLELTAQGVR